MDDVDGDVSIIMMTMMRKKMRTKTMKMKLWPGNIGMK